MKKSGSLSVLVVSTVLGSLLVAPASAMATEALPAPEQANLLAEAGLPAESWSPSGALAEVAAGSAPEVAWEPGVFGSGDPDGNDSDTASRRAADPSTNAVAASPTPTGGTGDTGYYSFIDFPVLSADGTTQARVNIGNGNLLIQATESLIAGPGVGIQVNRVWNSLGNGFGAAASWVTNISSLGLRAQAGYVDFFGKTGEAARFMGAGPTYTAPMGINATLVRNPDNTYTLTYNRTGERVNFNASGWPVSDTDRNGVGVTYSFDAGFNDVVVTDAVGKHAAMTFINTKGRTVTDITDFTGRTTYLGLGGSGGGYDQIDYTSGFRQSSNMSYDAQGRLTALRQADNTSLIFEYDGLGVSKVVQRKTGEADVVTSIARTAGQSVITDPRGNTSTYAIDEFARVSSVTDQLGRARSQKWTPNSDIATSTDAMASQNTTTNSYDGSNNLTKVQLPTGAAAQAFYAAGTDCPTAQAGNTYLPKCTMDDAGNTSSIEYDAAGNPTKQTDTSAAGAVSLYEYTYETNGSICGGKAGQVCSAKDANSNVTRYAYTAGNLVQVTPPAPLGTTTYTYDVLGRVTSVTDGNGDTTGYEYNQLDQVTKTTYDDGTSQLNSWAKNGELKSTFDSKAAILGKNTYNLLHKITEQKLESTAPGVVATTSSYTYDSSGNILSATDAAGLTKFSHDAANQLTKLTEPGGTCPATGTPAANSGCVLFEYDQNGAESKRILPAGANTVTERDNAGRPTRITAKTGAGATAVDIGYSYAAPGSGDDLANIQSRTSYKEQGITAGAVTSYSYDSRNRVTLAQEKVGTNVSASWAYGYDAMGNRTSQTRVGSTGAAAGTTNYTYNAAHQLTSVTGQTTSFTYDGAGNQTRNGLTGIASAFGDRLQMTATGSTTQTYFGSGNTSRLTSRATSFVNTPLGTVQETTGSGTKQYTYSPKGVAVGYKAASRWYYIQDTLGSVVGIFSSTGTYSGGYSYSPYGEARATGTAAAITANPLRYIGGRHESGGIYKLGARYYDTSLGRFTQMDPSGQEANPYAYAGSNPIVYSDPSGLNAASEVLNLVLIGLAAALCAGLPVVGCVVVGIVAGAIGSGVNRAVDAAERGASDDEIVSEFWVGAGWGALGGAVGGIVGGLTVRAVRTVVA